MAPDDRRARWKQTVEVAKGTRNETRATIITADPPATAYSNDYRLLDKDHGGTGFTPIG